MFWLKDTIRIFVYSIMSIHMRCLNSFIQGAIVPILLLADIYRNMKLLKLYCHFQNVILILNSANELVYSQVCMFVIKHAFQYQV